MPKLGMEPIRRAALVEATIAEVGEAGTLDVTVSQIARRAGMSSALAHHYFGAKEQIFEAAMRHILSSYGRAVRLALAGASGPRGRIEAIVRASFAPENFQAGVISAWLSFYVRAQIQPQTRRLLMIYQRRLRSNLLAGLRPLTEPGEAVATSEALAALIDGIYLRAALSNEIPDGEAAIDLALSTLDKLLEPAR
jgi:TetR/AcrR family transcriptional repressor of bet genes